MNDEEFKDFILRKYKSKTADVRVSKRKDINGNPVEFKLTFDEYFDLFGQFKNDPRLYEGKTSKDQLVLCRNDDLGSYELGNIYIATRSQNNKDQTNRTNNFTTESRIRGAKATYISQGGSEGVNRKLNSEQAIQKKVKTFKKINHQQREKNSQFGTCWITNGFDNKKINKDDYPNWSGTGWYRGRTI